jgi:hypothetical protein
LKVNAVYPPDSGTSTQSRPVILSDKDSALLFEPLETWSHKVSVDELPAGAWDLRCAIAES